MCGALHYLYLALLLSSAASSTSSGGRKHAVIDVGGLSEIQQGLLRTAKLPADPSTDSDDILEGKNLMASLNQPLNAPASTEAADLASTDSKESASKASDSDPDMEKAISGIDAELKRENSTSRPEDAGPMKFEKLDRLLRDLHTEEKENGELDKSLKSLDDGGNDHINQDDKAMSKDLEQSLADLNQTSLLPNAASLLQLEVDDETNRRMSLMLHRMGKTGEHIKHLTRRIKGLQRLHQASQNGASLLQLSSKPQLVGNEVIAKESRIMAESNKMLDKDVAQVQHEKRHPGYPESKSLSQVDNTVDSKSYDKAMTWLDDQIEKHAGPEKIDHEADRKLMDQLLAEMQAKYS